MNDDGGGGVKDDEDDGDDDNNGNGDDSDDKEGLMSVWTSQEWETSTTEQRESLVFLPYGNPLVRNQGYPWDNRSCDYYYHLHHRTWPVSLFSGYR